MAPVKKDHKNYDSMVGRKEMEDLAKELRNIQTEKEELKSKIEIKKTEIALWMDILEAKTGTEIEELVSSSPIENLTPVTTERQKILTRYNELEGILLAYRSSGIMAKSTPEGDTIVQFLPTKKDKFPEHLLLKLSQNKKDNTYSVVGHNLTDFVPIDELVEDYLSGTVANVKTFITHVALHTSQLIKRHNMFHIVRERMLTNIYYNPDRTKLCLALPLEQNEKDTTKYELILYYDPLDIVPHTVTAEHFDGVEPNDEIKELVKNLVEQLYEGPVNAILHTNIFEDSGNAGEPTSTIEGSKFSNILEKEV